MLKKKRRSDVMRYGDSDNLYGAMIDDYRKL